MRKFIFTFQRVAKVIAQENPPEYSGDAIIEKPSTTKTFLGEKRKAELRNVPDSCDYYFCKNFFRDAYQMENHCKIHFISVAFEEQPEAPGDKPVIEEIECRN